MGKKSDVRQPVAVMIQENLKEGIYNNLAIFEDKAILMTKSEADYVISFNPEQVNWGIIKIAGCMVIDEIILGFDLSDYFGSEYNVVSKFKA